MRHTCLTVKFARIILAEDRKVVPDQVELHSELVLRGHHAHHHRFRRPGGRWALRARVQPFSSSCYYYVLALSYVLHLANLLLTTRPCPSYQAFNKVAYPLSVYMHSLWWHAFSHAIWISFCIICTCSPAPLHTACSCILACPCILVCFCMHTCHHVLPQPFMFLLYFKVSLPFIWPPSVYKIITSLHVLVSLGRWSVLLVITFLLISLCVLVNQGVLVLLCVLVIIYVMVSLCISGKPSVLVSLLSVGNPLHAVQPWMLFILYMLAIK